MVAGSGAPSRKESARPATSTPPRRKASAVVAAGAPPRSRTRISRSGARAGRRLAGQHRRQGEGSGRGMADQEQRSFPLPRQLEPAFAVGRALPPGQGAVGGAAEKRRFGAARRPAGGQLERQLLELGQGFERNTDRLAAVAFGDRHLAGGLLVAGGAHPQLEPARAHRRQVEPPSSPVWSPVEMRPSPKLDSISTSAPARPRPSRRSTTSTVKRLSGRWKSSVPLAAM